MFLSQTGHFSPQSLVLAETEKPLISHLLTAELAAGWDLVLVLVLQSHSDDPGVNAFLFSLHQLDVTQELVKFLWRYLHFLLTHR